MRACAAICEDCGAFLPETPGGGLCANCVVNAQTAQLPPLRVLAPPTAEDGDALLPGHKVLEVIGTGGMGSIHRARQESLQRDVAVKIIRAERANEEDTERFLREARVLAQLDHPNIVPIYDSGTDEDGRCFYTMKMVRGRTLKAILLAVNKSSEMWTLERLLEIFRKICDAVAFAHARGVLHRDLKPDNIMVGEFGEVLVMDWGLAKVMAGKLEGGRRTAEENAAALDGDFSTQRIEDSSALHASPSDFVTMSGVVLGTPQYMSPEQADGSADLDQRCDVYMLGGLLYSILTLRPPVRTGTLHEMLESVRTGRLEPVEFQPQFFSTHADAWQIPPALAAVVRKAMALDRRGRFPTVSAFAADVDAHLAGYATSAEHVGLAGQLWLLIKRHRTVSLALLVLLLVSAVFVVQLIASERRATLSADIALHNETAARTAEALAHESEAAKSQALARANIALADSAYAANESAQMRAALDAVPVELRADPNWHYLDGRTDDRQALIEWDHQGFFIGSIPHPSRPGVFTAATGASSGNHIVTFEAATGKVLGEFSHRGGWVRGLAYSPDGRFIALSRIMDGGISIHNAEDGTEVIHWPAGWADSLDFLPDGKRLLQSDNVGCFMWEAGTGREIWRNPTGRAHLLLPGGERIASVSDTTLRLLSAEDGRELAKYPLEGNVPITASVSPDGALLLVAFLNGQIRGVRLADGRTAFEVPGVDVGWVARTAFTPDGRRFVVVASLNDTAQCVQLRDTATGRVLRQLRGGIGNIESLSLHPLSGELLVAGTRSATWALPQPRPPRWRLDSSVFLQKGAGGFFGGDDFFLAAAEGSSVAATDIASGQVRWHPERRAYFNSAASADGLAGVVQLDGRKDNGFDFVLCRVDGGTIRETGTVFYSTDPAAMVLNRDGSRLAMSGAWGGVDAFRTATAEQLPEVGQSDVKATNALAWHGRETSRLIGLFMRFGRRGFPDAEEWIISWDTDTGRRVAEVSHPTAMNCLATEPGGTRLAEAGDDKIVRIRDASTLAVLRQFRAHDGPINAIAWNPKRAMLATSSTDRSVRLWDVETGRMIEEIHIGLREPSALFFSPSGRRLSCVTPGEKTLIWELE